MVSAHCELARLTWSTAAIVGSNGAPRLATAVETAARNTSTLASRRLFPDTAKGLAGRSAEIVMPS